MDPAASTSLTARQSELLALLRLWPVPVLIACAVLAFGGPTWRAVRMAWSGGAEGGVQVDTSGASGSMAGGRFRLELPVEIINRGPNLVRGVSLWVETYGCPSESAPTSRCRRLTAFEQYVPARIQPGSADSDVQQIDGVAPALGETLRITRRLQAIDDERGTR